MTVDDDAADVELMASQAVYYRRRAAEYDATSYGDVAAVRGPGRPARRKHAAHRGGAGDRVRHRRVDLGARGIGRHGSLIEGGRVLFVDEHVGERDKETYLRDGGEIVERRLEDGSTYRIVKNFVDPERTEHRLQDLGWESRIRRDDGDWIWVCGEARPLAQAGSDASHPFR